MAASSVPAAFSLISWKLWAVVPSLVTLAVRFFGASPDGTEIVVSLSVMSASPSVGGLRFDFAVDTSNTFTMPCAACGEPSGAGTKHAMP